MNLQSKLLFLLSHGHSRALTFWEAFLMYSIPAGLLILFLIWGFLSYYEINLFKLFRYFTPLSKDQISILRNIKYYKKLSYSDKKKFERRVKLFIINKDFSFEGNVKAVTDEMKVLIAATCAQLTLGFQKSTSIINFNRIKIFSSFVDPKIDSKSKEISISWEEFKYGYITNNDAYNPGLEIMASALFKEDVDYTFGESAYITWKQKSRKQAQIFINSGLSVFKNIRELDEHKFFGVSVVYFFERPEDFKKRFPELYSSMVKMLKQDPLKKKP